MINTASGLLLSRSETSSMGEYILGIDLGANSLGWAILPKKPAANGDISCGSRIFEAGVDGRADKIAAGTDEPRAAERRKARLQRRQTLRRAHKRAKLFRQLQEAKLLPEGDASTAEKRHQILLGLDHKIKQALKTSATEDILPYLLRAKALDEPLPPHHLGRTLYHLAQRRGFLSNRVSAATKDEEKAAGEVKKGIGELREKMQAAKKRTLGEYLAGLNPHETRIRKRWTHRDMFEEEFKEICEAQAPHHPKILTPDLRKELYRTLFHQRPLKIKRQFLGECEFETGRKRAPWSLLAAQRFRYLQKINNLKVPCENGVEKEVNAFPEARRKLIEKLDRKEKVTYRAIKKLFNVSKEVQLNLESGGDTKIKGNVTATRIRKAIGDHWGTLTEEQQESLVEDMRSIQKSETLERRATSHWNLDKEAAQKLASVPLEGRYCNLSRQALAKLIPLLEKGVSYSTACKELYPERYKAGKPRDRLPPVRKVRATLRNPAVERSLTELRKVVNALLTKYGKPSAIHIELARDLRRPRKQRQYISKRMRRNERLRAAIRKKIVDATGNPDPRPRDILKVRLAEECNWICPYTGTPISMDALIGDAPQFDIEHIIPFDRCFDDSFANKTLCLADVNRHSKRGRTPWEAFHHDTEEWEQIIGRVGRFQGPAGREKLRRFQLWGEALKEQLNNFSSRHLNDTRYASRLAAEYLGMLYGGLSDERGQRRILVSSGQVTSHVRSVYGLNSILNDGPTSNGGETLKQRHDHRHHAVDAIALALTDHTMVEKLSHAAKQAESQGRRLFAAMPEPWTGFMRSVRGAVAEISVSHRVRRKVRGAMHEKALYSKPMPGSDKKGQPITVRHVRKPVSSLKTSSAIRRIVDDRVREVIEERVEAHDGNIEKALGDENNPPCLPTRNDESVPIRSVRIREPINAKEIGTAERLRHVNLGSNHHLEVIAVLDEDGNEQKWEGLIVTLYDAYQRKQHGEQIVKRNHGAGKRFKFSLCGGDTMRLSEEDGLTGLFQVRAISQEAPRDGRKPPAPRVEFVGINDARKKQGEDSIKRAGEWHSGSPDPLRRMSCEKVTVSPIGEVIPCHE